MALEDQKNYLDTVWDVLRRCDPEAENDPQSRANLQQVIDCFHAIFIGDYRKVLDFLTEDVQVELFFPMFLDFKLTSQGKEETYELIVKNFSKIDDSKPTLKGVFSHANRVTLFTLDKAYYLPSNRFIETLVVMGFRFENGLMSYILEIATGSELFLSSLPDDWWKTLYRQTRDRIDWEGKDGGEKAIGETETAEGVKTEENPLPRAKAEDKGRAKDRREDPNVK